MTLTPVDDARLEGDETVELYLADGSQYLANGANAMATIHDRGLPTVTITATDADASEVGPATGTFTVTRNGPTTAPLTVNYTLTARRTGRTITACRAR